MLPTPVVLTVVNNRMIKTDEFEYQAEWRRAFGAPRLSCSSRTWSAVEQRGVSSDAGRALSYQKCSVSGAAVRRYRERHAEL